VCVELKNVCCVYEKEWCAVKILCDSWRCCVQEGMVSSSKWDRGMWVKKSAGVCCTLHGPHASTSFSKCCGDRTCMGFVNVSPISQQHIKVTDTYNSVESYYILSLLSYYTKQDCHTSLLLVTQSNIYSYKIYLQE
jgi:hypothetical protein